VTIESFYSDPRLYDFMFPQPLGAGSRAQFYVDLAVALGGRVLEVACGTGTILLPIALRGLECEGFDLSPEMLVRARARFEAVGGNVELYSGNMTDFDLRRQFKLIFVATNSLLHLHSANDLLQSFRAVRRHLASDGRFAFDVFNPNVRLLAGADGTRREIFRFDDPERGEVRVDARLRYDAADQVTRGVWYLSTEHDADFFTASLDVRNIFPQELPLLLDAAGLRLIHRYGDFALGPFAANSMHQVCVCMAA
jgi:SAM-dependent methyltransferase